MVLYVLHNTMLMPGRGSRLAKDNGFAVEHRIHGLGKPWNFYHKRKVTPLYLSGLLGITEEVATKVMAVLFVDGKVRVDTRLYGEVRLSVDGV